jgi:hypothetical protein
VAPLQSHRAVADPAPGDTLEPRSTQNDIRLRERVKRETGDADILSCGDHGLWTRPGGGVSSVRKNVVRGADRVSAASRALLDEVLGDHSERDDLVVVFSSAHSVARCSPCLQRR